MEWGEGHGMDDEFLLEHRGCYRKLNMMRLRMKKDETSMKGFAMTASVSEMVSLGEGGEKTVGVKVVEVGVSVFSKEKLLVTGTEETAGRVREVEGKKARDGE